MRISDWSSDVCSSDLRDQIALLAIGRNQLTQPLRRLQMQFRHDGVHRTAHRAFQIDRREMRGFRQIARQHHLTIENGARRVGNRIMAIIVARSEEHTSELQSLMRISYAVFCLQKTTTKILNNQTQE